MSGQQLPFWDYSREIEGIELGDAIPERLYREIDRCTHFLPVISRHFIDPQIGKWCVLELEYVLKTGFSDTRKIVPVTLDSAWERMTAFPFVNLKDHFCYAFKPAPESIVEFAIKMCQVASQPYLPPIQPHPMLPFWEKFRMEVFDLAHKNRDHVDLMRILGEFNEYYQRGNAQQALTLIRLFIDNARYLVKEYQPFYPLLVRAVCETETESYEEALKSYKEAGMIHPDDQDVTGGMGTIYFKQGKYQEALSCFERILTNPAEDQKVNARINAIITRQAMGKVISESDVKFLSEVEIDKYPKDLAINILNAQAIHLRMIKDYPALEIKCREMIESGNYDQITIRLLELCLNTAGSDRPRRVL